MAKLTLNVHVNDIAFRKLKAEIDSLSGKSIRINGIDKAGNQAGRAADSFGRINDTIDDTASNTEKAAQKTELWMNVLKNAQWYLISGGVAAVVRSFKDAFETMKQVDDQLVVVRKVTQATTGELAEIEKQAYRTASAYGVAADAYLESVAAFARGGYQAQSEALAELSTKAQLVGDMTAETANQFLLSVDKAYQYKGSIAALTSVLDGANEIDNNYATSIEKIAEGLGIVAPVAKQAHVGINELTAAIGTITAVTQRSGSESARALRALFLNIVGDTKTEIDEGVTWTTGEIAGLRDVIKMYAKDAYDAAQASGEVINPMKAIAGLAQSMKDGKLSEAKLMQMVSDIGGKLRTSQLLALIQNWEMYEEMLQSYAGAIGSADREVANALDSWTRKTNILKNTWTEFMSEIVDTGAIKGTLDVLIGLVEVLNTPFGRVAATGAAVTAAILGLKAAIAGLVPILAKLGGLFGLGAAASGGWILAAVAGFTLLLDVADKLNVTYDEQTAKVKNLRQEYDALYGTGSEYDTLIAKAGELTAWEQKRLEYLEGQRSALEGQINAQQTVASEKFDESRSVLVRTPIVNEETGAVVGTTRIRKDEYDLQKLREGYIEAANGAKTFQEVLREFAPIYEGITENLETATDADKEFVRVYEEVTKAAEDNEKQLKENTDTVVNLEVEVSSLSKIIESVSGSYDVLAKAQKEVDDQGYISIDTLNNLLTKYPKLEKYLVQTADGYVLTKDALEDYLATQRKEYEIALSEVQTAAAAIVAGETSKLAAINMTTAGVFAQIRALAMLAQAEYYNRQMESKEKRYGADDARSEKIARRHLERGSVSGDFSRTEAGRFWDDALSLADEYATAEANLARFDAVVSTLRRSSDSTSSSGGSGSSASSSSSSDTKKTEAEKKEEQRLKDLREAINQALSLAKEQRDKALREIQAQIDALKDANEQEERAVTLEEKKAEIIKRQNELLEAQQERTIRIYNSKSGQWEWVADAAQVKSAQEAFDRAKEELRKYEEKIALDAAVAELEAKKDAINDLYDDTEKRWKSVIEELEEPIANMSSLLRSANIDLGEFSSALRRIYDGEYSSETSKTSQGSSGSDGSAKTSIKVRKGSSSSSSSSSSSDKTIYYSVFDPENGYDGKTQKGTQEDIDRYTRLGYFDAGGVLHGMGGIKATREDEIVIPPSIAKKMLSPSADIVFQTRMSELGYLYGAAPKPPATLLSGGNSSVTNNNGATYHLGGISITEGQAKRTTVYELARLAHGLRSYS